MGYVKYHRETYDHLPEPVRTMIERSERKGAPIEFTDAESYHSFQSLGLFDAHTGFEAYLDGVPRMFYWTEPDGSYVSTKDRSHVEPIESLIEQSTTIEGKMGIEAKLHWSHVRDRIAQLRRDVPSGSDPDRADTARF